MKHPILISSLKMAAVLLAGSVVFAAETPKTNPAVPVAGPQVDVTLRNGESKQGQLLSISEGNLSLKLENGSVVAQDGAMVASVRFLAPENGSGINGLSGQGTELNDTEFLRLLRLRVRDNPPKNSFAIKQPPVLLSDKEREEMTILRARADVHVKALEGELPNVPSDEAASAKLHELGRYYFLMGWSQKEIETLVRKGCMGIKNDSVRQKMVAGMNILLETITEKHKSFMEKHKNAKSMEKSMSSGSGGTDKPLGDSKAGATEKSPTKPPPLNGN